MKRIMHRMVRQLPGTWTDELWRPRVDRIVRSMDGLSLGVSATLVFRRICPLQPLRMLLLNNRNAILEN